MRKVSSAFAEISNLINAANWHRKNCLVGPDNECKVSIYMLGLTAKGLVRHCWLSERREVERLIAETNWM